MNFSLNGQHLFLYFYMPASNVIDGVIKKNILLEYL